MFLFGTEHAKIRKRRLKELAFGSVRWKIQNMFQNTENGLELPRFNATGGRLTNAGKNCVYVLRSFSFTFRSRQFYLTIPKMEIQF
jgi:hypothetical protein